MPGICYGNDCRSALPFSRYLLIKIVTLRVEKHVVYNAANIKPEQHLKTAPSRVEKFCGPVSSWQQLDLKICVTVNDGTSLLETSQPGLSWP